MRLPPGRGVTHIVHGPFSAGSRYVGLSENPYSGGDAGRQWLLIGQAALWSNLTDGWTGGWAGEAPAGG